MIYHIIPDIFSIEQSVELSLKYKANFEYSDFWNPSVYENMEEVDRRINIYKSIARNRSEDTMHGAFLGIDLAASDSVIKERSRKLIIQSLEIASELGVKGVIFHTGLIGSLRLDYYLNNWLNEAVSFWTEQCKRFSNLTVYMENSFEQEPDIFVRLMEQMKNVSNFMLCLDYGHAILASAPIEEWCSKLAPYIGHMHLNDNDLKDDLHLIPGNGSIDFNKWRRLMKENNICTSTLLELNGLDKAKAALEYMRENYGD